MGGVSQFIYGGEVKIDLTGDTVTPETLAEGVTAHNAAGEEIVGTMKVGATIYTGTIGTTWTENEDTGVKSQQVAIAGITAAENAKLEHDTTSIDGTTDGYAAYVEEENQFLDYITNGYAETYDGGIIFYIFGDAPTVEIPFWVEVC